jgi:hypothetical protein
MISWSEEDRYKEVCGYTCRSAFVIVSGARINFLTKHSIDQEINRHTIENDYQRLDTVNPFRES